MFIFMGKNETRLTAVNLTSRRIAVLDLPMHLPLNILNPLLHSHWYPPAVSIHLAAAWSPHLSRSHSFMSSKNNSNIHINVVLAISICE